MSYQVSYVTRHDLYTRSNFHMLHANYNVNCIIISVWYARILACYTNILSWYVNITWKWLLMVYMFLILTVRNFTNFKCNQCVCPLGYLWIERMLKGQFSCSFWRLISLHWQTNKRSCWDTAVKTFLSHLTSADTCRSKTSQVHNILIILTLQ